MTEADFTLDAYRDLIAALRDKGYEVLGYEAADPASRHLILRHDVDQSLGLAAEMAEFERAIGVASTYFVLVRTEMYNILSRDGTAYLRRILDAGHRVGLHLDAFLYAAADGAGTLEAAAVWECDVLEQATGKAVELISFHRPARSLLGREGTLAGRLHVYAPRFFSAMGYCSDSQGAWRHGHPLDHDAVRDGRALQLLTHPVWWATPPGKPREKLDRVLDERTQRLRAELADNCAPYRD